LISFDTPDCLIVTIGTVCENQGTSQRIERNNLTLRTRLKRLARKTICFSRSVELHEKVIGAFIEKHHFN